jgi:hypothetical protein
MDHDLIARSQRRVEWCARALEASAEELREAQPVGAELFAESERCAALVDAVAALRGAPVQLSRRGDGASEVPCALSWRPALSVSGSGQW